MKLMLLKQTNTSPSLPEGISTAVIHALYDRTVQVHLNIDMFAIRIVVYTSSQAKHWIDIWLDF